MAKKFKAPSGVTLLSSKFVESYKTKTPDWGFNGLGSVVYKRTYSRRKENGSFEEWYETIQRVLNGAQQIGADYTPEELERLYDYIFYFKCSLGGRMLWQLGTSSIERFGANSLLNCFAYETEILTQDGIKEIGSLAGNNATLLSENGKWVNSEIRSFGTQKLFKIVLKKKLSEKIIYSTKNHKWFRKPYRSEGERDTNRKIEVTTGKLKKGDDLVSIYGQGVKNISDISYYGIAHGIVFGDGSKNKKLCSIRLCGEKNKRLLKYFANPKTYKYKNDIIINNLPSYFKNKPEISKHDKTYLYGWLAGYFAADGHTKRDGQSRLASANKNNLLFVRDVCSVLGIGYSPITKSYRKGFGKEKSFLYSIDINIADLTEDFFLMNEAKERFLLNKDKKKLNWKVSSVKESNRKEKVFCAVVPKTHSFVLENNILTSNCWFSTIKNIDDFCFIFENLMLGGGVGFSVRREDIHELPKVKNNVKVVHRSTKDTVFIVPDSREGWVELLRRVLTAYLHTGQSFDYSTILIRGNGELINGFGGIASGPRILVDGIKNICSVLENRANKKLRSVDVLDVCNLIGSIVVSGNVRRSAQVSIGDPDDFLFIRAKRWDLGNIPNWRSLSNNSIYADNFSHISNDIWSGYAGNGEAYGLFNINLAQSCGRIGEKQKDNCEGGNPCMEVTLANKECCCLSEVFLNNITSAAELIDVGKLLYKTQKAICNLPFIHKETEKIVKKNQRIGIGVTGICQSLDKLDWLDKAYKEIKVFDKSWSKKKKIPQSIKLTTVKPSGTLSLLAGSTPGIHPAFSEYYIRRIQLASDDKLIDICKKAGYKVYYVKNLDGTNNRASTVIEFPCFAGEGVLTKKDMTAIQQLELVKKLQHVWSDNSVSVTVYYEKEELDGIKKWLEENYEKNIKTISFLLKKDHGFTQTPYEEISKEEYEEMIARIGDIKQIDFAEEKDINMEECKGSCPIK